MSMSLYWVVGRPITEFPVGSDEKVALPLPSGLRARASWRPLESPDMIAAAFADGTLSRQWISSVGAFS